jgi:HNH endonuclease
MPEFDATVRYADVVGAPGYKVGTDGSVWTCWIPGARYPKKMGEYRQLKPCIHKMGGYHLVTPCYTNGGRRQTCVHVLILEAFVGPCPPGMVCRHFPDRDPTNNRLENLQWGTYHQNAMDRITHGTDANGEKCCSAKLTVNKVKEIRDKACALSQRKLAKEYGVSQATIADIIHRKIWRLI